MCLGQWPITMKGLGDVLGSMANRHERLGSCVSVDSVSLLPLYRTSVTDLYGLDAELQHLIAGRAGEVDVDAGQRGEHQLLGQLVDQRHAQPLLQVHQHPGNRTLQRGSEEGSAGMGRWIRWGPSSL